MIFRYFAVLTESPLAFAILIAAFTASLLVGLVLHEVAHAYVADSLGDGTPRRYGRLSLNPLRHLDPLGSTLIFIVGFGWAKPVPIGPNSGRNIALIALAGPATNLVVAATAGLAIKLGYVPFYHPFVAPSAADYWARVWTDSPDHLVGLFLGTIVLLNVIRPCSTSSRSRRSMASASRWACSPPRSRGRWRAWSRGCRARCWC